MANRFHKVRIWDGVANCYSPWWLDANHAPPGAGYLHLILWIWTDGRRYAAGTPEGAWMPAWAQTPGWSTSFVTQGKSRDLRSAKLTMRLRGELDPKGARLLLLAHAKMATTNVALVLTGQPILLTEDWSEQTVTLSNDPQQWTCLGARRGMERQYGCDSVDRVLADVNMNLILVLFPLHPAPAHPGADAPGKYAGIDYPADAASLPKGLIQFQSIRIDYPAA